MRWQGRARTYRLCPVQAISIWVLLSSIAFGEKRFTKPHVLNKLAVFSRLILAEFPKVVVRQSTDRGSESHDRNQKVLKIVQQALV